MKSLIELSKISMHAAAALVLGLLILAPSVALADTESDAHEHAGFSIGGQGAYFRNNKAIDNDWYGGGDLRWNLAPAFALDGMANYRRSRSIDNYPTQGSLMLFLTPQYRLTPYILGGGTWYFQGGNNSTNRFGPHAGAGLEFFVTRDWSVDASWRYLWLEKLNSGSNYFNRNYDTNGYQVTAGVHFHF